jgi:hypothetical protein
LDAGNSCLIHKIHILSVRSYTALFADITYIMLCTQYYSFVVKNVRRSVLVIYGDTAIITTATPPCSLRLYIPVLWQWVLGAEHKTGDLSWINWFSVREAINVIPSRGKKHTDTHQLLYVLYNVKLINILLFSEREILLSAWDKQWKVMVD